MSSEMLRSESKKSVEKQERRKGLIIEDYHPFIPLGESSDLPNGIRKCDDKLTLESEQLR